MLCCECLWLHRTGLPQPCLKTVIYVAIFQTMKLGVVTYKLSSKSLVSEQRSLTM